ncbi:HAD family hydrolase [Halopseudomonas bauzanensis]|uniref:Haloacid dehalogenase superfamily, subfamily IA, variant 3 with third motif having DD or ED n=1 Tax=Halopseudomonas bauzanensis TaxID=653930 RepID=A0A031MEI7_9GAMM|nr:HAD-IA family hydrolase [Halopseudomonas bauzanensis]EZQ18992.1 HAD family hydrolase [Halopseudomonas bauzanensis]SER49875.1 haloacid dehalogenase superfamily, subfamily IA, variant 3 with third motif having DD or ED [Halopseudomonas bauzanensis]SFL72015.1 haloacid dehalogenase superfamily, subfamily IA, variant 3 with third motif having DD or ED [Halopseudomonas bauzanensis]
MQQIRGWIFDLDGTLTVAQHDFPAIRRELGIPADEDILTHLGRLPIAERQRLNDQLDAIELRLAADVAPAPGAAELVRALHAGGQRLGILTRNLRSVAMASLERIGVLDCFTPEHIIGRDEAPPKPAPDGIHRLLADWQLSEAEAVMVGDFRFDLEAGRAAGCRTCLVFSENAWPEMTDLHVPDCQSLLARLRAMDYLT